MYCITFYFRSEKAQPRLKGLKLKNFHNLVKLLSPKNNDTETQSLYFQNKHFKHREPNNANTVSIFNFVALTNPMIFFKFSKILYTVVGYFEIKISSNVDRVYIFCALHMSIENC